MKKKPNPMKNNHFLSVKNIEKCNIDYPIVGMVLPSFKCFQYVQMVLPPEFDGQYLYPSQHPLAP